MAEEKDKKELIPEEKEKQREIAMKNLKNDNIRGLAAAYFVDDIGEYGEADNAAIEKYKYFPAIKSEDGQNIVMQSLLGSRGKKRYSGQVRESDILETAANIFSGSLAGITVQDALNLMGSGGKIKGYSERYIADLQKGSEKDQEFFKGMVGSFNQYFVKKSVSEALDAEAKDIAKNTPKNLEEIIKSEEKPKR